MEHSPRTGEARTVRTPHFDLEGWVGGLAHAVARGIERHTAAHGLTVTEFTLLRVLVEKQERTSSQLAQAMPIDRARLDRVVANLVDRGLLRRRDRTADPRAMLLGLTQRGRYLAWKLHLLVQGEASKLLEGVSEEEVATLSSVVSRIVANGTALEQS